MANLTQEAIARRDAARNTSTSPSGRASYVPPLERERAAEFDYRQKHDAEIEAARASLSAQREADKSRDLERKAHTSQWREQVAKDELKRQQDIAAYQQKITDATQAQKQHNIDMAELAVGQTPKMYAEIAKRREAGGGHLTHADLDQIAVQFPDAYRAKSNAAGLLAERKRVDDMDKFKKTASVSSARSKFDAAQSGLDAANAEADAWRAGKDKDGNPNSGKPIPPSIAGKIARFESQIPLAGTQLARVDPDSAPDVAAAVKAAQTTSLLRQHADIESKFKDKEGAYRADMKPEEVADIVKQINPVKAKLGFDQLQVGTDGKVSVLPSTPTPAPTPTITGGTDGSSSTIVVPPDAPKPAPVSTPPPATASATPPAPDATGQDDSVPPPAPAGDLTPSTAAAPVATAPDVPGAAIAHLRQNPHLASDFDAKFGEGASARILGQ